MQVKAQVAEIDREMAVLREEYDEEQVKRSKLMALLKQYSSGASADEITDAMATKIGLGGKSRTAPRSRTGDMEGKDGENQSQYTSRSMATATVRSTGTSRYHSSGLSRTSRK